MHFSLPYIFKGWNIEQNVFGVAVAVLHERALKPVIEALDKEFVVDIAKTG